MSVKKKLGFWRFLRTSLIICTLFACVNYILSLAIVFQLSQPKPLTQADAVVVLGAAAWDKRPSPVFRERINHALYLYRVGLVKKILFTGGTSKAGFMSEAAVGRRYAIKHGIDKTDIVYENQSRDTWQNLVNAQIEANNNDINSVIIVSDPYHLARAKIMGNDLGLNAQISPTPTTRYTATHSKLRFLAQESYLLMLYQWSQLFHSPVFDSLFQKIG